MRSATATQLVQRSLSSNMARTAKPALSAVTVSQAKAGGLEISDLEGMEKGDIIESIYAFLNAWLLFTVKLAMVIIVFSPEWELVSLIRESVVITFSHQTTSPQCIEDMEALCQMNLIC